MKLLNFKKNSTNFLFYFFSQEADELTNSLDKFYLIDYEVFVKLSNC